MNIRERLKALWKSLGYNYHRIDKMSDQQVCAIWHRMQGDADVTKTSATPIVIEVAEYDQKITERDFWTDKEWASYVIEED